MPAGAGKIAARIAEIPDKNRITSAVQPFSGRKHFDYLVMNSLVRNGILLSGKDDVTRRKEFSYELSQ
jgi:hypothetical protein